MYDAYSRIFSRLGMRFRAVEADSGPIGGSFSHEFMVLADTGEDVIAVCADCQYAANLEKASVVFAPGETPDASALPAAELVDTPGAHTVEEVAAFLQVDASRIVKTLLFSADGEPVAALVRGDRELNEVKLKNALGCIDLSLAEPEQVTAWTGAAVGFAGPVGLQVKRVLADAELQAGTGWVVGANKSDAHLRHVDLGRDADIERYLDLRTVTAEDRCPRCGGRIELPRGIEVGHVFKLGLKYSQSMNASFLDENGKEQRMVMGCYGIGVSRIVAACIEQNHDEAGIVFPPAMAPFEAIVLALNPKDAAVSAKAQELHDLLQAEGLDALLDDRDERPGVKFKDADLTGAPMQLVVGGKGLEKGVIEVKDRRTGEKAELPTQGFAEAFAAWRTRVEQGWGASR